MQAGIYGNVNPDPNLARASIAAVVAAPAPGPGAGSAPAFHAHRLLLASRPGRAVRNSRAVPVAPSATPYSCPAITQVAPVSAGAATIPSASSFGNGLRSAVATTRALSLFRHGRRG